MKGGSYYRGQSAVTLAEFACFEDVAGLLVCTFDLTQIPTQSQGPDDPAE